MQNLKIALVQTKQFWESKEDNFRHYNKHLQNNITPNEVDLVLLPEMFNTGFSMDVNALAESMNGKSIQWMISSAKTFKTQIGGSLIIEENGNYFNRFVIVGENGVLNTYNKRHLFRMADEHLSFNPGEKRVVHILKGWKLMLQVCYDLRFPVFSRNGLIDGDKEYDALVYIANWPKKRAFIWKNLIQARAIENQAFCIGLNRVGSDGNGVEYSGDSMLVDPWGNIILAPSNEEKIDVITLNYSVLTAIKKTFPAYLDADQLDR